MRTVPAPPRRTEPGRRLGCGCPARPCIPSMRRGATGPESRGAPLYRMHPGPSDRGARQDRGRTDRLGQGRDRSDCAEAGRSYPRPVRRRRLRHPRDAAARSAAVGGGGALRGVRVAVCAPGDLAARDRRGGARGHRRRCPDRRREPAPRHPAPRSGLRRRLDRVRGAARARRARVRRPARPCADRRTGLCGGGARGGGVRGSAAGAAGGAAAAVGGRRDGPARGPCRHQARPRGARRGGRAATPRPAGTVRGVRTRA